MKGSVPPFGIRAIRKQWIDYWDTSTGHRASMTAEVK
jgi:hypothetical protein